jgi:hypothetical protein
MRGMACLVRADRQQPHSYRGRVVERRDSTAYCNGMGGLWTLGVLVLWFAGVRAARPQAPSRVAVVVPGLLLLAIAAHHVVAVRETNLTVWKGGGFGMFATADKYVRRLHVFAVLPNGRRREFPTGSRGLARRAILEPSASNLRAAVDFYSADLRAKGAVIHAEVWAHELAADALAQLKPRRIAQVEIVRE